MIGYSETIKAKKISHFLCDKQVRADNKLFPEALLARALEKRPPDTADAVDTTVQVFAPFLPI